MQKLRLACIGMLSAFFLQAQNGAVLVGTVLDSHGGEPLANVAIRVLGNAQRTYSDSQGSYSLPNLPPGDYVVQASTVGYRVSSSALHVKAGELNQLNFILSPDAYRRVDTVAVHAGSPFNPTTDDSVGLFSLTGNDIRNLSTVLADDPLRAVQSIPGVTADDDFEARFSLRGTNPNRVGIYLDGIELHRAVHTLEGVRTSGSNSVFNPDLVSELNLYNGVSPPRFSDNSAGALDVVMRDGNFDNYSFRAEANFADAALMAEGPVGGVNQCSWISAFRKSYLQYLLQQALSDPSMSFGFQDAQGRVACRVTPASTFTLDLIDGQTGLDLSSHRISLGPNSLMMSQQSFATANLGWQYVASNNLLVTSHLAWMHDRFYDENPSSLSLGRGSYGEWVGSSNLTWAWKSNHTLSVGANLRSIHDAGFLNQFNGPAVVQVLDRYAGSGTLAGGYVEHSWTTFNRHIHVTTGVRWDHHSIDSQSVFSPQAGLSWSPWSSTQLRFGWGQFAQFPEVSQFTSSLGNRGLLPFRSTEAIAAIEQRLGERTRVQATFFDRQDRNLLSQPLLGPRLIHGSVFIPPPNPAYQNSLRGYGRGFELLVQRSNVNGWTGWVSYAYGQTNLHDSITGDSFPSDFDQRHTLNAYASYRIRPSMNISARYTYGSGYPIPAYLQSKEPYSYSWADVYDLGEQRNRLRVGAYQRLDLRVNKSWTRTKWKTTLYGEVMNVTGRANYRFDNVEAFSVGARLAYITLDRMFPVLPSVGVAFER